MLDFQWKEYPAIGERVGYCRLPSGMEVTFIPKQRTQTYATLRVGLGACERDYICDGRRGWVLPGAAHFIEHKLFADPSGTDAAATLGNLGAYVNAYTSPTSTCYLISARERFGEALAELLRFVSEPYFTKENVALEKDIIIQEAAMYADRPSHRLFYLMLSRLYRHHPIRTNACGTEAEIKRITPKKLLEIYEAFYRASNFRLTICGGADPSEILQVLDAASLRPGAAPTLIKPSDECFTIDTKPYKKRMQVSIPQLAIGIRMRADSANEPRRIIEEELIDALIFQRTGELFSELYRRDLLHTPLLAAYSTYPGASFLTVEGESREPEAVFEAFWQVVEKHRESGFAARDFARVYNATYADFVGTFDNIEDIVDNIVSYRECGMDYFEYGELLASVNADDLHAALLDRYRMENAALAVILPEK